MKGESCRVCHPGTALGCCVPEDFGRDFVVHGPAKETANAVKI